MSDTEKQSLKDLFTKRFNILTGLVGVFIILFITFMIRSSNKDGIQDTQIANIVKVQTETGLQLKEVVKGLNVLVTQNEVRQTEYGNLLKVITDTNEKAQKLEWAVLTNDKSIITRNAKKGD